MIIFTEATPNPDAMKFRPHVPITDGSTGSFDRKDFEASASALAAALFEINGVQRIYISPDFVTVVRAPGGPGWDEIRCSVTLSLAEHIASGVAALEKTATADASGDKVEEEIRQVLELHVRPAVGRDGGDVVFDRFEAATGILWVSMQGACGGCPSARLTLKAGVERIVRRYIPEVLRVEEQTPETARSEVGIRLKRWAQSLGGTAVSVRRTVFTHNGRNAARP